MAGLEEEEPFTLRAYIQTLTRISKPQFEEEGSKIEDWIRAVCSNEESLAVNEEIRADSTWPRKNEDLSRRNREDGNQAYQEEQFELAITLYTEAMRFAPCNPVLLEGEALAWAAANRSAAFYQQQQYRQALEDIEIAIAAGYPTNSIYKLYIRRCKCELEMGRIGKAQEAFDKAVEAIEWSGLKKDVRSDLTSNLQEAFITLAKTAREEGVTESVEPDNLTWQARERLGIPDVLKLTSNNPKMPAASDAVKVVHEPGVGRFVVATRDVQPGEVIFTESPIVSTVCDEHVESICLVCLRYTTAPLPCPTCSDVSFCSLSCRSLALNGFHKYECKLTQLFIHTGIKDLPLLLMALRSITQQPVEYFVKNKDKFSCPDAKFGLEDQYMSTDYSTIFNLCTHREKREPYDLYTKTVFACFLLRCLQETGYFKSVTSEPPSTSVTDEEVLICRLLKHFLECIQFNTHTVESIFENRMVAWDTETRLWKSSQRINIGDSIETNRIGGAVYPTLALVNHSCDPNFVIIFWGRTAIAVASRTIFKGEEMNDNYGANYANTPLATRRKTMERSHWFTCACRACENNFPEFVKCAKDYKKLPGSAFKHKRCDRQKLNRSVELIKKDIKSCASKVDLDGMFQHFVKWGELVDQMVLPPHQDFINIRKGIRNCLYQHSPNKCRAREDAEDSDDEEAPAKTKLN